MKKIVMFMIAAFMTFLLIACSDSQTHDGEAKTPSASGAQKGRDYQSVVEDFEERGFTNISLVALDDLITGWLTKDHRFAAPAQRYSSVHRSQGQFCGVRSNVIWSNRYARTLF